MYLLGQMTGALIATLLVSRLLLFVTRSWQGGLTRLFTVHVFSWLVIAFIAGLGGADGGAFAGLDAATIYLLPQLVWLLVDIVYHRIKSRRAVAVSGPRTQNHVGLAESKRGKMKWLKGIGVSLAAFVIAWLVVKYTVQSGIQWLGDETPGLNGETRTSFIKGVVNSCFSTVHLCLRASLVRASKAGH
jgi:hypothetical protein